MENTDFVCGKFIRGLGKNFKLFLKENLKTYNLKVSEFHLLHILCKKESAKQNSLTNNSFVDKSTVTRNIKKLANKDLIKRSKNDKDKRQYIVKPTKKGIEIHEEIKDIFKLWNIEIMKNISKDERKVFERTTKKLLKNSHDLIERINNEK
ncbi:MAG: MarR family winged helix-turn-helix transcriptional regulator [Bacillota bacterium]